MNLQPWLPAQDSPEVIVNENFEALSHMATFAKDPTTTTGLTWGYVGGRWGGFAVAAGTLTLPANSTLYITASRATGAISVSSGDVNWQNTGGHARVYKVVTGVATVTSIEDYRAGYGGVHGVSDTPGGGSGTTMATVVNIGAASHSVTQDDLGVYMRFTATGAKTVSLDGATVTFAQSQEFHIANRAPSGSLTLTPSGGIVLYPPKAGTLVLEPGDTVTVKFVSANSADVFGSTEAAA